MRVRITKPKGGRLDVVLDDSRGATGRYQAFRGVAKADVGPLVMERYTAYRAQKRAIREARKASLT